MNKKLRLKEVKRTKQKEYEEKTKRLIRDDIERIQSDVYTMLKMHSLFDHIQDKVLALVELDLTCAVDLFLQNAKFIHATFVVEQVKSKIAELDSKGKRHQARLGAHALDGVKGSYKVTDESRRRKGRIDANDYRQYLCYFLYLYLNELVGHRGGDYPEFHDELVTFYAQFDTTQLLQFLNLSHDFTF